MMTPVTATSAEAVSDPDTEATLRLWIVLNRAQRAVAEHSRRDVERHGLGPTEFAVLEVLHHRGPLPIGEVGERILITSGSTTYVVDKLQERGLVERRPCAHDRRVQYAGLTAAGHALMRRIFPEHAAALLRAMQGLTLEEKQIVAALLRRLGLRAREEPVPA